MKKIFKLFMPFIGLFLLASTSFSQIQVQSFKIDSIKGDFVVKFTMSPSHSPMNASIGLGPKMVAGFSDFNVMIRFNAEGNIDVRNGGNFMADSVYPYAAGTKYYVEVKGNTDSAKCSVSIRELGKDSVMLAIDYGFRMNNYTGIFHYFSELVNENTAPTDNGVPGSFIGISDFQVGDFASLAIDNFSIPIAYPITGDFGCKFVLTPSHSNMNASAGLSKIPMSGWGDFNTMIQFNPDGNIKVRDSSLFIANNVVPYEAGKKYTFLVWGNTNTSKYNVKLYDEKGDTVTLAENYRFRQNNPGDTLNYLCVKINQNPAEGIPESYLAVDGIEIGTLGFDGIVPALSQAVPVQTGDTTVSFVITPVGSSIDALYAFNELAAVAWGELNAIVRFNPDGKIDARDSASWRAEKVYPYVIGVPYQFTLEMHVATQRYSVFVKDSVNSPVDTIALNYQFRPNHPADSILYKTTKTNKGNLMISSVGVAMPGVVVVVLDFSALEEAIANAQARVDDAVEGTGDGEYLPAMMDMAENAIAIASEVLNSAETQEEIDNAAAVLTAAMVDFIPNEINSLNNISETVYTIYPNPANDFIYIENAGSIARVEIFSVVGERVVVEVVNTENMAKVSLFDLENGIYFIKITNSENNSSIQKLIKK